MTASSKLILSAPHDRSHGVSFADSSSSKSHIDGKKSLSRPRSMSFGHSKIFVKVVRTDRDAIPPVVVAEPKDHHSLTSQKQKIKRTASTIFIPNDDLSSSFSSCTLSSSSASSSSASSSSAPSSSSKNQIPSLEIQDAFDLTGSSSGTIEQEFQTSFFRHYKIDSFSREGTILCQIEQELDIHIKRQNEGKKKIKINLIGIGKLRSKKALKKILELLQEQSMKGSFEFYNNEGKESNLLKIIERIFKLQRFNKLIDSQQVCLQTIILECLYGRSADLAHAIRYILEIWPAQNRVAGSFCALETWIKPLFESGELPIQTLDAKAPNLTYEDAQKLFYLNTLEGCCCMQQLSEKKSNLSLSPKKLLEQAKELKTWIKPEDLANAETQINEGQMIGFYVHFFRSKEREFRLSIEQLKPFLITMIQKASSYYEGKTFTAEQLQTVMQISKLGALITDILAPSSPSSATGNSWQKMDWIGLRSLLIKFGFNIEMLNHFLNQEKACPTSERDKD